MDETLKKQIFERDKFKCHKCGYRGLSKDLEIHQIKNQPYPKQLSNFFTLCQVCKSFAPNTYPELKEYLNERVDWQTLETFRKAKKHLKTIKDSMNQKAKQGKLVTRAPLGYKVENKELIPEDNSNMIRDLFEEFLKPDISLTQLAKKNNLSVNGLKKILTNFTYLGKIKFAGEISSGTHPPLVSSELFNQVQKKIENISR